MKILQFKKKNSFDFQKDADASPSDGCDSLPGGQTARRSQTARRNSRQVNRSTHFESWKWSRIFSVSSPNILNWIKIYYVKVSELSFLNDIGETFFSSFPKIKDPVFLMKLWRKRFDTHKCGSFLRNRWAFGEDARGPEIAVGAKGGNQQNPELHTEDYAYNGTPSKGDIPLPESVFRI